MMHNIEHISAKGYVVISFNVILVLAFLICYLQMIYTIVLALQAGLSASHAETHP